MQKQIASAWAIAGTAVAVAVVVVTGSTVGLFGAGGEAAAQTPGTTATTVMAAPAPASGVALGSATLAVSGAAAPIDNGARYESRERRERSEEHEYEEREHRSVLTRLFSRHDD